MKLNKIMLAAVLAFSASSAVQAASPDQGHGTVTFTGSIIDAPCSITPDTVDQTVKLGEVTKKALENSGTSVPQNFSIKLTQCDTATLKNVSSTFTGAPAVGNPDNLGITGTASGASIVLTDGSGKQIKLGQASAAQRIQDGNNDLVFSAYLKGDGASAALIPGDFTSVANFTLAYQ